MSHRRIVVKTKIMKIDIEVTNLIIDEMNMVYHYEENIINECFIDDIRYRTNIKLKDITPYIEAGYTECEFCGRSYISL